LQELDHFYTLQHVYFALEPNGQGSGAWPLSLCSYYFNRKLETQFNRFLAEPWPSRLQLIVGPVLGFCIYSTQFEITEKVPLTY
jgi:hypothetical protein